MVARTYYGLGPDPVAEFDALLPHVLIIRELQARCAPSSSDDYACQIAIDGLDTAAYHFTRRRHYFEGIKPPRAHGQNYFEGLGDRTAAVVELDRLRPYNQALRLLQDRCAPFRKDYLALAIATLCLETCAYHFTKIDGFYGVGLDALRLRSGDTFRPPP